MSISKNERVLIVINHLASGDTDYLYRFIEDSARTTVRTILGDDYAKIVKLYDTRATLAKLVAAIKREGAKNSVKRIDLIVMLHGHPGRLVFHDRSENSSVVKDQIKALNLGSKLRLVYSTCCHGDSHSMDFIAAGFDSAIGSKKVNANAAVEFAPLLSLWQFNARLSDCLAPTTLPTPAADAAATLYGHTMNTIWKNDVDSTKRLRGNPSLQIST
jgi:hypothetical protein